MPLQPPAELQVNCLCNAYAPTALVATYWAIMGLPQMEEFCRLARRSDSVGAQAGMEAKQAGKGSSTAAMQSSAAVWAQRALVCGKDFQFQVAGGAFMLCGA